MEAKARNGSFLLPQDASIQAAPLNSRTAWSLRTWDGTDGSLWIGEAAKNAAWKALRRTREALEKYKNSGQASVQRLDIAFEEIYSAQNSNYFAAAGNASLSPLWWRNASTNSKRRF